MHRKTAGAFAIAVVVARALCGAFLPFVFVHEKKLVSLRFPRFFFTTIKTFLFAIAEWKEEYIRGGKYNSNIFADNTTISATVSK